MTLFVIAHAKWDGALLQANRQPAGYFLLRQPDTLTRLLEAAEKHAVLLDVFPALQGFLHTDFEWKPCFLCHRG